MTKLDLIVFLIAGLLGAFGSSITINNKALNVAWLIVAVWALLKLFHLFPIA